MNAPEDYLYTKEHEWVSQDDATLITVGITDYAQEALGSLVLVELPEEGEDVTKDEPFGIVESPKSVSDLFAPVSGKVAEVNQVVIEAPAIINEDPYNEGWLLKIEIEDAADLEDLMNAEEYLEYVSALDEQEL